MSTEARQKLIYGDGALQRARLSYNTQKGKKNTIPVQFNPTEYAINRSVKYKRHIQHLGLQLCILSVLS